MKDNKYNVSHKVGTSMKKSSLSNDKNNDNNQVDNVINYISGDDFPTSTSHKFNRNTRENE
jgi:hypothetical protein